MFDELRSGPSGTFALGGAEFEVTTATRTPSLWETMWVQGLHWPHCCECEGGHAPINFGEGRSGGKFHVANFDFWVAAGVEVRTVEAEMNRWLDSGDLPDWALQ